MELTFDALSKNYGKKQALIGFSAELTGGIYGLLGPNGAGKSTLMNILTGNLRQTAGEIRFNGAEIRSLGAAFRGRVGYMPQQQTLYPGFTAERFLLYMASLRRMPRARALERIDWALGAVGLSDVRGKTIRSLSGGMKQRLLLAQAILDEPDILILDEPTAGLDPRQRIAVRNLIAEIALQKIVIVSTHVVPDVEYVASELLLLSDEEIRAYIATGEPMDKAGAYAIQGLAAMFVIGLDGDYYNVMGLPVCPLAMILRKFGVKLLGC